jgi:hypothetical protein
LDRQVVWPDLDTFASSAFAILRDLFVRGDSWFALTGPAPFVSWPLAALLAGVAVLLGASVARGVRFDRSERWTLVLLLAFGLTLLLASVNARYPGVRRIFPATVLLIGSVGLLVERARRAPRWTRVIVAAWVAGALVYEGVNTVQRAREWWDLDRISTPLPFALATADVLRQRERVDAVVFYPTVGFRIDGLLCALYFDRELHRQFGRAYVVRSEGGLPLVLEDGRRRVETIPEAGPGTRLPLLADQPVPTQLLDALAPPDAFEVHVVTP